MASRFEQRAAPRHPPTAPGRCHLLVLLPGEAVYRPVVLGDLSREGLRVLINRPVAEGAVLPVRLRRADGRLTLMRNARVRYVVRTPTGTYALGLAFDRPLTPYAVESLRAEPAPRPALALAPDE